jgi:putative membrane-bound dehydrogenase-like protein
MKPSPLSPRKFPAASGAAFTGVRQTPAAGETAGAFEIDRQSHLFTPEMVTLMEKRSGDPHQRRPHPFESAGGGREQDLRGKRAAAFPPMIRQSTMRGTLCACILLACAHRVLGAEMVDRGADLSALPAAPPEFTVTVFAKEPLVRQPCSMAFDARGRLFIGMGPQYRNPKPDTPGDSVVMLLDTDGDGVADTTKVFATGFNAVQGLAWHGRDLWVANSPDLTVVRDLDGDDVADEYVRVYTDLGNLEHGLHGLVWAPDGKLYMSKGNSKGLNDPRLKDRVAPKPFRELFGVSAAPGTPDFPEPQTYKAADYRHAYHDPKDDWGLMGGVLRCDDMGSNLEIVARGFRNPWDIAIDSGFHWLGTDNDQNEGDRVMMPFFGAHYGWNHPWSADWTGEGHLPTVPVSAPVFEGSGTGIVFSDSPQMPPQYRGVFFINDWLRKTMFVFRPTWDGALMRAEGGKWQPFVKGGASLFRPTDLAFGPDGALWCLGWSRGYGAEMKDGEMTSEGRVYRIAWKDAPPAAALNPKPVRERNAGELIAEFDSPIAVRRIDAQDELAHREAGDELIAALQSGALNENQETWTAWALGRMTSPKADAFLGRALAGDGSASLNLRVQSLRILANRIREHRTRLALPRRVSELANSQDPRLRFEAVQAIWQARQASLIPVLQDVAARETDRLTFYSAWRALRELASTPHLKAMLGDRRGGVRRAALLALLEDGALNRDEVQVLRHDTDAPAAALANAWLQITGEGGPKILVKGPGTTPPNLPPVTGTPPAIIPPGTPTTMEQALAAMITADPARGRLLVLHPSGAGCIVCHSVNGRGNHFGPELTGIGDRAELPHLLQSLIDPSAVITEGFNTHVVTAAGSVYTGVLLEESGLAVALGLPTGQRVRIMRADITKHDTLPVSAMPPFAAVLSAQQCADIAAWLLSQRAGAKPDPADVPPKQEKKKKEKAAAAEPRPLQPPATAPLKLSVAPLAVTAKPDRLLITQDGAAVGEFIFNDAVVKRPFFANLRAPGGIPVTRTYPPVEGRDPMDHPDMHPGIWLGFGNLAGEDFWRNKAAMRHERFLDNPRWHDNSLTFATLSSLVANDGSSLGEMKCQFSLAQKGRALCLVWDAAITPLVDGFSFGDQEEMGFGVRVATAINEKNGGTITNSEGATTAKQTWGRPAAWCDYSGVVGGHHVGVTIVPDPASARPSWWHNRDYGLFVANAFGRKAMKQGGADRVEVKRGETYRLRHTAILHASDDEHAPDLPKLVRDTISPAAGS